MLLVSDAFDRAIKHSRYRKICFLSFPTPIKRCTINTVADEIICCFKTGYIFFTVMILEIENENIYLFRFFFG